MRKTIRIEHVRAPIQILQIALGLVIMWPSLSIAKNDRQQQAEAYLARAHELSDIRCAACPPFRLKTRVQFYRRDQTTSTVEIGSYVLVWQSKLRWREELNFPNTHSVRWGLEGKLWREDSFEYPPLRVVQLEDLVSFPVRLLPLDGVMLNILPKKSTKGGSLPCVEKQIHRTSIGAQCFDSVSGALTQEAGSYGDYEYADLLTAGAKSFPRNLRALEEGKVAVQIDVEEIRTGTLLEDALFIPSGKAVSEPVCDGGARIELAKLIRMDRPSYPAAARAAGVQGIVGGFGVVGPDGKLHGLEIVHSLSPEVDAAALAAWRQWEYRPTFCQGLPTLVPTHLETTFSLK